MAIAEMTERTGRVTGFEYYETIADTATGDSIKISPMPAGTHITCTVVPGAGTGKFQTTTSSAADIIAGSATWVDWAEGNVTATTSDVITGPVTGIRGVSISGEINIEVVI